MLESEKANEKLLNEEVKKLGGWAIKLSAAFISGLPDRLILLPGGILYFVEMKSERKKPSAIQKIIHRKLAGLGFTVEVIDTKEKVLNFIDLIK
mgnify:CR=1 FL=1|tara:strand:+ start:180 stop:461 length:282 start_codon:yes stop_codon:yes gene_type:complete